MEAVESWIQALTPVIVDVVTVLLLIIKLGQSIKGNRKIVEDALEKFQLQSEEKLKAELEQEKLIISAQQRSLEAQQKQIDELTILVKKTCDKVVD